MTEPTSSRAKIAVCVQALLIVLLLVIRYFTIMVQASPEDLLRPACALEIGLIVWMACSWWWVNGTLFDPYMLLVLSASIFHAGQMILEVLGLNRRGFLRGIFPAEIALDAVCLVVLCFAVLHFGALLAVSGSSSRQRSSAAVDPSHRKDVLLIGWIFFALSAFAAPLVYKDMVSAAMSGGYFVGLFESQQATGIAAFKRVLAEFFIPAALFLLAGSGEKRLPRYLSLGMVIFHCGMYLIAGSRGSAAVAGAAYAWLWHRMVRPIPKSALIGSGALALFVVFPSIALIRGVGGESRFSLDYLTEQWESMDSPATAGLTETGGTLGTVAYTLQLVPIVHDFDKGRSYATASLTIFPNLFWDINPGLQGRPAEWLVSIVNPKAAYLGASIGYSFIAEAYYNFGWYGALVLGLIGFAVARLLRWANQSTDPLRYVCLINFAMPLFWYTRNEATGIFREMVWYALFPYLLVHLLAATRRARQPAPRPALREPAFMQRIARFEAESRRLR